MVSRKIKYLIPKDRSELIPLFMTIFIIFVYFIFELYFILPTVYHNNFTLKEIFHLIFGFYIIFNLIGNLYISMITNTSIDTIISPVMLPTAGVTKQIGENTVPIAHCNWRHCYFCEVNVPPRSEHCFQCQKCILKRDHHCSFIGKCIGYRNIRYYMCFLIWSWIGLLYCNLLHLDYTYELVGTFSWRVILASLFPLGAWAFHLVDHFSLLLSCICSTSIILCVYVSYLIIQQVYFIANCQTWFEYKNDIRIYNTNKSLCSKFKEIVGRNWLLVLFYPFISSYPIGDGMTFDTDSNELNLVANSNSKQT